MPDGTLTLSMALSDNERTRPLMDGSVVPKGLTLLCTQLHPSEMFWRQLKFREFDISEMSLSSLLIAASRGDTTWAAIPVFTSRAFYHTRILVRKDRGIETPADLKGKRVGVPEYQQTAAVWSRGALKQCFGVRPEDIDWVMERGKETSHGASTGFTAPPGVRLTTVAPGSNIGQMLVAGELDASLLYLNSVNLVDRSTVTLEGRSDIGLLFADPSAEARRFHLATGIYPINHTVVVRRALLERHPWVALNLFAAFREASNRARASFEESLASYAETGLVQAASARLADPKPYGLAASRGTLETLVAFIADQGLLARSVTLEDVFAPSTLGL